MNRLFTITLELRKDTRDEHGEINKDSQIHNLYPCYKESFKSENYDFESEFKKYEMRSMACPDIKQFKLKGSYLTDEFKYMRINVRLCVNSTDSDIICPPREEILSFMKSNLIRIQFFYIDNIINPANFERPVVPYLTNQQWLLSPWKEVKAVDMFVMKHNITSNRDWLPFSSNVTIVTHRIPSQNLREQVYENDKVPFFRLVLRMDQFKAEYYRQYMDLIDMLSNVGGIVAALISVFGVIAIPYNIYKMKVTIANEIYEILEKEASEKETPDESRSGSLNTGKVEQLNTEQAMHMNTDQAMPRNTDQAVPRKTDAQNTKKIKLLNERFAKQLSKKSIKTSLGSFFEDMCCFWKKTPSKNQILLKAAGKSTAA